jgi:GH25 family lysozyme M1 (1,4-beta-N-acetylmuramidase)
MSIHRHTYTIPSIHKYIDFNSYQKSIDFNDRLNDSLIQVLTEKTTDRYDNDAWW